MCTSIATDLNGVSLFGRNLDLEYDFGDGIILLKRDFPLHFRCEGEISKHPAIIGCGAIRDSTPLFAEGMNEYGVCAAALDFKGYAKYAQEIESGKTNLAPFELIPYILAKCDSVANAKTLLEGINVTDIPFDSTLANTGLHWHIADKKESIVYEVTENGTRIYENPFAVLANNPPFPFHREHLSLFLNLDVGIPLQSGKEGIRIYGNGLLAHGLPGDYSSPSRFVKAYWLKEHAECEVGTEISTLFSILGAVAPPSGSTVTSKGKLHFTRYSCVMDITNLRYYFRHFRALDTRCIDIKKESLDGEAFTLM